MTNNNGRIAEMFAELGGDLGFIPFLTAGYPTLEASREILLALPDAGADLVELGMPFSDPIADGPTLQKASQQALENGANLDFSFELAADFRRRHPKVPLVLMGYVNPLYQRGYGDFAAEAAAVGVDGVIAVDLPLEEDAPLGDALKAADLAHIKLATPTTDDRRLAGLLKNAAGFLYYVTVAATTGSKSAKMGDLKRTLALLKKKSAAMPLAKMPLAAGFGFRSGEVAAELRGVADAVVVGSALAEAIAAADSPLITAIAFASKFSRELKG